MLFLNKVNNIDDEYDDDGGKKIFNNINNKVILGALAILIILIIIVSAIISSNNKIKYYLVLDGSDHINIYLNQEYSELGYKAYDSKSNDLTNEVIIDSNLDVSKVGSYEINYTIKNITKTRYVNVIENIKGVTEITLKGDKEVNIPIGSSYYEEGYLAIDTVDGDITNKVIVNNNVNTTKAGHYSVTYYVVNSSQVYTSIVRKVNVIDFNIKLSLSDSKITKEGVDIIVTIEDEFFDYLLLPDNNKVEKKEYKYHVNTNGNYKFVTYNKYGYSKEASITVRNIDKGILSATCDGTFKDGKTYVSVNAKASSGISRYVINGISYVRSEITINKEYSSVDVTIYDNLDNSKVIKCDIVNKNVGPIISSISNNGVIVSITATKYDSNISGYYFSYNNQRPSKTKGGYISTSANTIDVVRLPGTTYVWVEDSNGHISSYKTITLSNSVLPITYGSGKYTVLNQKLSTFLSNKGWSLQEFNKLIARSVRAAGLNTKMGAATAGVALQAVLAQKYNIKLPYRYGTKYYGIGAYGSWGLTMSSGELYGFDCDGFVYWSYINGGIGIKSDYTSSSSNYYLQCFNKDCGYRKETGEIGDILAKKGHVRLIIGKEGNKYIVGEGYGTSTGAVINYHDNEDGYIIIDGKYLIDNYVLTSSSDYPSGF